MMRYLPKIILIFFFLISGYLSAQNFSFSTYKARLSNEIFIQIENIFSQGNYKHDKAETKKKIQIRIDSILTNLNNWIWSTELCDSSRIKECDEMWSKEETEANEQCKRSAESFRIAESNLWYVILAKPTKSMSPYNTWLKYYLKYEYQLEMDIPPVPEESDFAYMLKEIMYQLLLDRFGKEYYSRIFFATHYNHCGYLLKENVKTLEEYKKKISLIDSLVQSGLKSDSVSSFFRESAANVYHSLAQNYVKLHFINLEKSECEETFALVEHLFLKSLFYKQDARVYFNFALHYYNHSLDLFNSIDAAANKKAANKTLNKASDLFEKSKPLFEKACELDNKYCEYWEKFKK